MSLGAGRGGDGGPAVGGLGPAGGPPGAGAPGDGGLRATAARHALLPLRIFLGFTFVYAGLDKLTDDAFLSSSGPGSLAQMLEAVRETAGAAWMVDLALENPEGFGYAIATGELAVGLGTLAGLWTRLAALGGAVISLTFWLTVSWPSDPYYYGNDLPYLMAWTPLILAGAPLLSLDAVLATRRRRRGRHIFG
ncbi:DoxX family protein [Streptomyces sp. JJ36]|uniref:DoxX family protein n=1 Tax=Streptomyces sp. JJ36 TaxID=2736645 RepID=UPI001F169916|nr:DoxX family protein [Streptomyces sp. JJ36]MCF6526041.1 DoxX family protein [Streptomyces sp. JJ36]